MPKNVGPPGPPPNTKSTIPLSGSKNQSGRDGGAAAAAGPPAPTTPGALPGADAAVSAKKQAKVVASGVDEGNASLVEVNENMVDAQGNLIESIDRNSEAQEGKPNKPVTPGPDENDEKLRGKINKLIDAMSEHADKIMMSFAAMVSGGSPLVTLLGKGLGDATKNMIQWLKPGKKKTPKSSKAQKEALEVLKEIKEGALSDMRKFDELFGGLFSKSIEAAKEIGANISKRLEGVTSILKKGVEATKQGVANATKWARKQLEQSKLARFAKKIPGGGTIKGVAKAGMFAAKKMKGGIVAILISLAKDFTYLFVALGFLLAAWIKYKLWPDLKKWWKTLKKWWKAKIESWRKKIEKFFGIITDWWDDTITKLTTMFENIKKRFTDWWGEFDLGESIAATLGFFKEIGAAVSRSVKAGLKALLNMFGIDGESFKAKYWDPIAEWFSKLIDSVVLIFKDPVAGLKSLFSTVLEGYKNVLMWIWNIALKPLLNGIGNFFTDIWERMKKKFTEFDLWKTISDGFNSLWEIITGWFDIDWKAALNKLFGWLPDDIKELFGIGSPGDKEKPSPGTVPSDHYSEEELQEVEKRANQMARNAELQKQKDKNAALNSTVKDAWNFMTGKGPKTPIDELIPVPLMERGGRAPTAVSDATKEAQTAGATTGNLVVASTPIDQSSTSVAVHQGEHTTVLPTPRINSTVSEMNSFGQTTNPLIT